MQVQVLSCNKKQKRDVDDDDDDEDDTEIDSDDHEEDSDDEDDKEDEESKNGPHRYVRIILNDAPVPLTGINGCKENDDGLCEFDSFVSSMHTLIGEVDHAYACTAEYEWDEVVNGAPPRP